MSLEVLCQGLHEEVHFLEVFSTGLLLAHLLIDSFPILLQLGNQEILNFIACICKLIDLVLDLLLLHLQNEGPLFMSDVLPL